MSMTLSTSIQSTLLRHQAAIQTALRKAVAQIDESSTAETSDLHSFYGQIQYHLGWVNADLLPTISNPGKLIRPTLLILAYEASGAWGLASDLQVHSDYLQRVLPAAAAIELTHNFTLIHDDIEDGDTERRHRATLWTLWGVPQAINTGDGLFALSRLTLWGVIEAGVEPAIAARLGAVLDRACLVIAEGQYLDISFEKRQDISVSMYVDMISRKTAALMGCAAEMGALMGTRETEIIDSLRKFGFAMGIAFQVRDDLLGVWASTAELGKTPAGDVYRRKKSLPILHALEHANEEDQRFLREVYQQESNVTSEQVDAILAIFERTQTRAFCRAFLLEQCQLAHQALASVPRNKSAIATRALEDMETLVHFVEADAH